MHVWTRLHSDRDNHSDEGLPPRLAPTLGLRQEVGGSEAVGQRAQRTHGSVAPEEPTDQRSDRQFAGNCVGNQCYARYEEAVDTAHPTLPYHTIHSFIFIIKINTNLYFL